MINDLYNLYFKKYSNKRMLYKYVKKHIKYTTYTSCILFFICSIYAFNIFHNSWLLMIGLIVPAFLWLSIINHEYKRILEEKYKIKSYGVLWNNIELLKLKKCYLKEYLEGANILNSSCKMDYLINLISEKIEDSKAPYFRNLGIFAAILVPIWTQYVVWVFQHEIKSLENATYLLLIILSIFLIFLGFIFIITPVFDDWINGYYLNLKSLNNVLKELYFDTLNYDQDL